MTPVRKPAAMTIVEIDATLLNEAGRHLRTTMLSSKWNRCSALGYLVLVASRRGLFGDDIVECETATADTQPYADICTDRFHLKHDRAVFTFRAIAATSYVVQIACIASWLC